LESLDILEMKLGGLCEVDVKTLERSRAVSMRYLDRVKIVSLERWAESACASALCSGVFGLRSAARSVLLRGLSKNGVVSRERVSCGLR
jgi:hypothetical protein